MLDSFGLWLPTLPWHLFSKCALYLNPHPRLIFHGNLFFIFPAFGFKFNRKSNIHCVKEILENLFLRFDAILVFFYFLLIQKTKREVDKKKGLSLMRTYNLFDRKRVSWADVIACALYTRVCLSGMADIH